MLASPWSAPVVCRRSDTEPSVPWWCWVVGKHRAAATQGEIWCRNLHGRRREMSVEPVVCVGAILGDRCCGRPGVEVQ